MQTTITVEATTKESKQAQGKTYWGVKQGNDWFNLITNQKPAKGAKFNVDVKETEFNGRTYRWATIVQAQQAPASAPAVGNGHIPWADYRRMAESAHELAKELEPDDCVYPPKGGSLDPDVLVKTDRSAARAAILNTVMIAFSNGKIALPKEDEPPPFEGDDIPF